MDNKEFTFQDRVPHGIFRKKNLSNSAWGLYSILLLSSDDDNTITLSNKQLMEFCGFKTVATLNKYKNELVSNGMIVIERDSINACTYTLIVNNDINKTHKYVIRQREFKNMKEACAELGIGGNLFRGLVKRGLIEKINIDN